ncbi:GNAT family N-acetyltransferase [Deinococcus sp.]|uniref:GNAT family N-acetyltransferase n=1 Tax=Deinococcus sp. TaxID=47478 RepID=UPI003CC51EF5
MSYTLRPATSADAPAFHAVMMSAGMDARSSWNRVTVADVRWSLDEAGGYLALNGGGAVVGVVGWRPDLSDPGGIRTLTLNKLAVLPDARGLGLARRLVQEVEGYALRQGFERVLLAVSQYNLGVLPFYERLGYRVSRETYLFAHPGSPRPVVLVKNVHKGDIV